MSFLTAHRFSVEEYYRMGEVGILKRDMRVELLEGQIIDSLPGGPFHGSVVSRLLHTFCKKLSDQCGVVIRNPLRLSNESELSPDVMLVKPSPNDYSDRHPILEDVLLLVEVADSSLVYDRSVKLPFYARGGVPECWIVNLAERKLEIYREPGVMGYGSKQVYLADTDVASMTFPHVTVSLKSLFST